MRLTVIGCGYLGAVHAAAMADLGHHVLGVETDPARLERLVRGEAPYQEIEIDGSDGRHSKLHETSKVDDPLIKFLWGK